MEQPTLAEIRRTQTPHAQAARCQCKETWEATQYVPQYGVPGASNRGCLGISASYPCSPATVNTL
jgi:hypothetical protein